MLWIDFYCRRKVGNGLQEIALPLVQIPSTVIQCGVIWTEANGVGQIVDCLVNKPASFSGGCSLAIQVRVRRVELDRGVEIRKRLVELLKQGQYQPLPFSKQILIIFAGTNKFLDDIAVEDVRAFETELYKYVDTANPKLLNTIMEKKTLDDALKAEISKMLTEFKQEFVSQRQAVAAKA